MNSFFIDCTDNGMRIFFLLKINIDTFHHSLGKRHREMTKCSLPPTVPDFSTLENYNSVDEKGTFSLRERKSQIR